VLGYVHIAPTPHAHVIFRRAGGGRGFIFPINDQLAINDQRGGEESVAWGRYGGATNEGKVGS
jgi:hypothetical protein